MQKSKEEVRSAIRNLVSQAEAAMPAHFGGGRIPRDSLNEVGEWREHEHRIWKFGEDIRQLLAQSTALRKDTDLQHNYMKVIKNRNGGRGRQSFVMLLGYKSCQSHATSLAEELDDPDIDGHVIYTLLKMRADGFRREIEPFRSHKVTWIRNKARQYCERYSSDT